MNRLWWVDPGKLLLFLILPLFLVSTYVGGDMMPEFGSVNFLTRQMIGLGAVCVVILALGALIGASTTRNVDPRGIVFEPRRFDAVLVGLLIVTLIAHIILVGSLATNPSLIRAVLAGQKGAVFDAKDAMAHILGVTSLTNLSPVVYSLSSIRYITRGRFAPSPRVSLGLGVLGLLVVAHAILGSERLALIENAIAASLPLLSFVRRWRTIGVIAPFGGIIAVLILFAFGEYTRSWAYYQNQYDSFGQFVAMRLSAYIAGASNNGAGLVLTTPPLGRPEVTGRWLAALIYGDDSADGGNFFRNFGNEEFNNPGGIYGPVIDFGLGFGILYLFLFGLILGIIYGLYRRRHPIGMLAHPLFFIGLVDLTQIWYWGEPRFIPMIMGLFLTIAVAVLRRRARIA